MQPRRLLRVAALVLRGLNLNIAYLLQYIDWCLSSWVP